MSFAKIRNAGYTSPEIGSLIGIMDLQVFTTEELERLLKILPEEIRRREMQDDDAAEAERRKRRVFASFQELAKKQGVSLGDL